MTKAWGKVGSWAAVSEEAEAELSVQPRDQQPIDSSSFPSLNEALSTKPKKKKQQQTFTISELTVGKHVGPGGKSRFVASDSKGLTVDEMMALPTGPRERSEEEDRRGGLGGGFKDYGGYRGGRDGGERERDRSFGGGFERERSGDGFGRRDRMDESSRADESEDWGASKKFGSRRGGYEDDARRGSSRMSDREDEPSRADGSDDWVASKKSVPLRGAYEDNGGRRGRMSDRDLPSKADADDNWVSNKKGPPPPPTMMLNGRGERRYELDARVSSRADEAGNWNASKKSVPNVPGDRCVEDFDSSYKDRDLGSDPDRWCRRERPRLVLQPRTLPVDSSSPPTSVSEVENSCPSGGSEQHRINRTPKANPFGDARPREQVLAGRLEKSDFKPGENGVNGDGLLEEVPKPYSRMDSSGEANTRDVLLEEKGMCWKKTAIDLQRNSFDSPDPGEELLLKEEVKAVHEIAKRTDWKWEGKYNTFTDVNENQSNHQNAKEQLTRETKLDKFSQPLNDKICVSGRGARHDPLHTNGGRVLDIWAQNGREHEKGARW